MAIRINYEDDIFLLQTMIKTTRAAVQLDVDGDLFRDKIIEDLMFIHTTVQKLFRGLHENRKLLRRAEYLRSIMLAKSALIEVLEICLDSSSPLYAYLASYTARLRACRAEHHEDIDDIRTVLQHGNGDEPDDEDVVSQEEFLSLLQQDEDESEQD